jgi:hypothetical protein
LRTPDRQRSLSPEADLMDDEVTVPVENYGEL